MDSQNDAYGQCECGKDIKVYRGISYEIDANLVKPVVHECDPEYVTDYWTVRSASEKLLGVVSGKSAGEARTNALKDRDIRNANRLTGITIRRMKSREYKRHVQNEHAR